MSKLKVSARPAAITVCLLVLVGLVLLLARPDLIPAHIPGLGTAKIQPIELTGLAWVVFGIAIWLSRKATVRAVTVLVLGGVIVLQVAALAGPPRNSSDLYRYIWDGRVQVSGTDPYLYAPGNDGVAHLRDEFLWSPKATGVSNNCVKNQPNPAEPSFGYVGGCTKINRPTVPTVYPPVAEAYFTAVQLAAPADDSTRPVQAGAAAFAVLTTVILLFGLRRRGKDLRLAALWAWCPTVALEAGQNGHVDVVGVALAATALLLLAEAESRKLKIAGGALMGLAIATKVTPVLALPGVLRRGWRLIAASALSAIVGVYVPHVVAVGSRIIGFFPGYLNQEGYSNGTGFDVIGLVVKGKPALAVAVVILGLVALAILRYGDPRNPWRGGVYMTSAALAVCTPDYQWYAILLVMLVALDGRPEWLLVAAGGYLANSPWVYIHGFALQNNSRLIGYGGGAAAACLLALVRLYLEHRRKPAPEPVDNRAVEAPSTAAIESVEEAPEPAPEEEAPVIEPTAVITPRA